jgi:pimeloyl-ACP methyl ester carboxylesterase
MTTPMTKRVDLAFEAHGDPRSPAVVLLHALGRSAACWAEVSAALAPEFHVIAPDLRGHGRSPRASEYSFECMRDDVLALLDRLQVARFSLVGHSMGGTVSYLVAQARPEGLESLVIEDTPLPRRGANLPLPPERPPSEVPFDWPLARAIVAQLNDPDPRWWEGLRSIRAPTLVLAGGPESPIDQTRYPELLAALPRARLVTLGGGHYIHRARPREFIAEVRQFLAAPTGVAGDARKT